MALPMVFTIENDFWQVGIVPQTGGALGFGRVRVTAAGPWYDFLRPTPPSQLSDPGQCASFPMIPWSNRVRDGRFTFRGQEYTMQPNFDDGNAIHGVAWRQSWSVEHHEPNSLLLTLDAARATEGTTRFPWRFSTRAEYRVSGREFIVTTWLRNEDTTPMPGGFGHHPYFMRYLTPAVSEETDIPQHTGSDVQLQIPCARYYIAEQCIPSTAAVPVEPRVDFQQMRPLGNLFIDDCLTARDKEEPIRFAYVSSAAPALNVSLYADAIYEHVVLYAPLEKPYFALEPATNANDGFNLYHREIPGTGVFVLAPGEEAVGAFRLQLNE